MGRWQIYLTKRPKKLEPFGILDRAYFIAIKDTEPEAWRALVDFIEEMSDRRVAVDPHREDRVKWCEHEWKPIQAEGTSDSVLMGKLTVTDWCEKCGTIKGTERKEKAVVELPPIEL